LNGLSISAPNIELKRFLKERDLDGKIASKWIINKLNIVTRTGFNSFRISSRGKPV
jgi:hypothetical protein